MQAGKGGGSGAYKCKWCKWVARARKGLGLRLVSCWAAKLGADFVVTVRVGCWAEKLGALFPLARVPARSWCRTMKKKERNQLKV